MAEKKVLAVSSLAIFLSTVQVSPSFCKDSLNFSRASLSLASPDGMYKFQNKVVPANRTGEMFFVEKADKLILRRKNDKSADLLTVNYHRNVDVLWAPNSCAFVINNWEASNHSDATLYLLRSLRNPISIREKLLHSGLPKDQELAIINDDHNYVFVEKWDGADKITVKASGHYSNSKQLVTCYTFYYQWTVSTNSWKLLKSQQVENLERSVPNMKQFGA